MRALEKYKAYEGKTFGDAAALYLAESTAKSADRQEQALRSVLQFVGDIPLSEIDDDSLSEYKQKRCRKVMVGTVNKEISVVRTILNNAVRVWGWMPAVPYIRKVSGPKKKSYPLTRHEERKLLRHLKGDVRLISKFVLNTGIRRHDVVRLTWKQEHDQSGIEYFALPDSGGNRYRYVVLNRNARKVLHAMEGRDPDFVFPNRSVQKPIMRAWINAGLPNHPLIKKGISNFRLTFERRLRLAGANGEEVDTLLGLRYWRREERHAIVDLERLAELVDLTMTVKDPDLPIYFVPQ